ncbi:hypothetical protein V6Z12_A11G317500 [Gossypium hirsutum]
MAPSQPTTDAFVPHRRFTTLRFLLHLRLQRDEEEPMADLRGLLDTYFTLGCLRYTWSPFHELLGQVQTRTVTFVWLV